MIYLVYEKSTGFVVSSIIAESKPTVMSQHDTITAASIPPDFALVKVVNGVLTTLTLPIAVVEARLIERVKVEAESRKMLYLTAGGAKKAEYAQKRAEVATWDSLGGTVNAVLAAVNLLSQSAKEAKFAYAVAEAATRGETNLAAAITRFRAGMDKSQTVPLIAAVELKGTDSIKAATTAAAKQAAFDAIVWPAA